MKCVSQKLHVFLFSIDALNSEMETDYIFVYIKIGKQFWCLPRYILEYRVSHELYQMAA